MEYASFRDLGAGGTGKVNHERVLIGEEVFDSIAESERYMELKIMEKEGKIGGLVCHPRWEIIPPQKVKDRRGFRAAHYTADFSYRKNGALIVEDVKSDYTRLGTDYILRRKLMYLVHGIYVEEVIR